MCHFPLSLLLKWLILLVFTGDDDKEDGDQERKLDPKHNPDLRNFVRARLDVCREQLNDVLDALKAYCHTGETRGVNRSFSYLIIKLFDRNTTRPRRPETRVRSSCECYASVNFLCWCRRYVSIVHHGSSVDPEKIASTLQFSLAFEHQTAAVVTINTLWLSSLVLGIGSAFNSLLAMTMRKLSRKKLFSAFVP